MTCEVCAPIEKKTNLKLPHVIRKCASCGDEYAVREAGKKGIGFKVQAGDRFVMPAGFIKLAANPLKASGQMSRAGIDFFAKIVFGIDIAKPGLEDDFLPILEKIQDENEKWFIDKEIVSDIDWNQEKDVQTAITRLSKSPDSVEFWAMMAASLNAVASEAIKTNDAAKAAWAMASAERFRALITFKENFADVVYMGHSAGRLIQLLKIWENNKENGDEGFWQRILSEHAYAFSQLFSVPVTFLEGNAYVGGTQIDRADARYVDFMLMGGNANHAIIVEIKTPTTKLLTAKYRGNVFSPSKELGGSIVQAQDYCDTLRKNVDSITKQRNIELNTFNPRRVVLIGTYNSQLTEPKQRSSFELFRSSLSGVEVITFDEFFNKIEQLAKLFNLTRITE